MTISVPRSARVLLAVTLVFGAGACSASAEVDTSAPTAAATDAATTAPAAVQPTTPPAATAPPEPEVDTATETTDTTEAPSTEAASTEADAATGNGTIEIAFDDGRQWTLNTIDCYTSPDSPFGIFFMVGRNDAGADLSAVESWPLDGDKTGGTAFIASFYDEEGGLYGITGGPVTDAGGTLSFSSPVYEGLSLEPFTNGTFSCTP